MLFYEFLLFVAPNIYNINKEYVFPRQGLKPCSICVTSCWIF